MAASAIAEWPDDPTGAVAQPLESLLSPLLLPLVPASLLLEPLVPLLPLEPLEPLVPLLPLLPLEPLLPLLPASGAAGEPHLPAVHAPVEHSAAAVHSAPSAFFEVQTAEAPPLSQNCVAEQSASSAQTVPQAPEATLQIGPPWVAPAHAALVVHLPHDPSALTYGSASVGQGAVAAVPLSPFAIVHEPSALHAGDAAVGHARVAAATPKPPLQASHAPEVRLQAAVVPVQSARFVAEHWVHWPRSGLAAPVWQAGAPAVEHLSVAAPPLSPLHALQSRDAAS